MRGKSVSAVVQGPGLEAEQLWYDRSRWASWVDGFASLSKLSDDWPLAGSRRVWVTRVGGRGLVSETVLEYTAGSGQTLEFEDERVRGVQRVRFETDGSMTRITVTLEADSKAYLAPARKWWLRRRLAEAARRSLQRFSYELAAEHDR